MNWLIKLLGGVTASDFNKVFDFAASDSIAREKEVEFLKQELDARQKRVEFLEDLIMKKTGFLVDYSSVSSSDEVKQPIGGQNTWGKVKHQLEMRDHKLMLERNKKLR